MIYECCYSRCHSPLLLPLRFYSLVWIITVTNSSCSRMAFWIEREGESASEREAAIERREAWEINSSELTLRGPGTAEYCSSGGEMGRWRGGRKEKNPYAAREMNLMISGGRGEDHHSLLLTIKIRLASTVSTQASVKAWQRREGGQPTHSPPPWVFESLPCELWRPHSAFHWLLRPQRNPQPLFIGQHCNRRHLCPDFYILATRYCCFCCRGLQSARTKC